MFSSPEDLLRIILAIAAGGVIGMVREFHDTAVGLRTLVFICVGATLLSLISLDLASLGDPGRIASGIVTGIGFLGAGVIIRERGRVPGITTAAIIWLLAAIGMGLGFGQYLLSGIAVGVTLAVLLAFPRIEKWAGAIREERTYEVLTSINPPKLDELEELFRQCGLVVQHSRKRKSGGGLVSSWRVAGPLEAHQRLVHKFLSDQEITEFRY